MIIFKKLQFFSINEVIYFICFQYKNTIYFTTTENAKYVLIWGTAALFHYFFYLSVLKL